MFGGSYFAGAAFAGVLAVAGELPGVDTLPGIIIGGEVVTGRVRVKGVTIHDILNDAPNTAALTLEGAAPAIGQPIQIQLGAQLLFGGVLQTIRQSYTTTPAHPAWDLLAIDDTGLANARRPFGAWVTTSATTIAQAITATFAPGFAPTGIEAGLPPVSIVFDGADSFIACLTRLATLVGGYAKIENRTVYLFTEDAGPSPDPIDPDHCFLHNPPIVQSTDASQLRTRVYGKGYGESVPADVLAGETLLPLENGAQFAPTGGQAIAGVTADGAQFLHLAYTGVDRVPGGTLVGPGAAPTTAPGVSLSAGAGVESGDHDYAIVFVTAAGSSLPGPRARITVGQLAAPPTALTAGTPYAGPGNAMTAGSHRYYAVFRTASGTTPAGPASNAVTAVASTAAPGSQTASIALGNGGLARGQTYYYKSTWYRASDGTETDPSPPSAAQFTFETNWDNGYRTGGVQQLTPPSGFVQRVYRTNDGAVSGGVGVPYYRIVNLTGVSTPGWWMQADAALGGAPPATNTTGKGSSTLTNIPVGPSGLVTHVDLYREFNNAGAATARLLTSQPNGTTSIVDGLPNESLGGLMPTANTAAANQVRVSWPAAPAAVTGIHVYRTQVGSTTLRAAGVSGSNAAGSLLDATPDASLGPAAPGSDTSGLTQPTGQVNPGAPALPVASTAPFRAAGGWVQLAGEQYVRYTGISGSTLTGIPASGAGAITTTVIYGGPAQAAPMLVGVTGLTQPIRKGAAVHLWIQRDDLPAQAEHAARTGGDGIVEFLIVDQRRGVDSLTARCDADLALFARPLVTVTYVTHDTKTKSGKTVVVALPPPLAMAATLTIQEVTITDLSSTPGRPPRYTVQASSVRFSLEDTLRRLIVSSQASLKAS